MIGCLRIRVRIVLDYEFETVLMFYNLEASTGQVDLCFSLCFIPSKIYIVKLPLALPFD